jgi:hypothetical protein
LSASVTRSALCLQYLGNAVQGNNCAVRGKCGFINVTAGGNVVTAGFNGFISVHYAVLKRVKRGKSSRTPTVYHVLYKWTRRTNLAQVNVNGTSGIALYAIISKLRYFFSAVFGHV